MKVCFYCALRGQSVRAVAVAHDKRGCLFVCGPHAEWRRTTSSLMGHGEKCPGDL